MTDAGKRTVQVNVKMNEEDFALLRKAAATLWPDAIIGNSGILLGLARLAARQTIAERKDASRKGRQ